MCKRLHRTNAIRCRLSDGKCKSRDARSEEQQSGMQNHLACFRLYRQRDSVVSLLLNACILFNVCMSASHTAQLQSNFRSV